MQNGTYQLLIYLPRFTRIKVGQKGVFRFPKGYYVYTGSAKNGLKARVERHLRQKKRYFWHIDYLLKHASIRRVFLFGDGLEECSLAKKTLAMPGARVVVPRFGASDCRCVAHLVYFQRLAEVPLNPSHEVYFPKR